MDIKLELMRVARDLEGSRDKVAKGEEILAVADAFTRFLIGNRQTAINQLSSMKNVTNESLGFSKLGDAIDNGSYNQMFLNIKKGFIETIKKNAK